MSPVRILILLGLFYLLFRLLIDSGKQEAATGNTRKTVEKQPDAAPDVLMEDPVCHVLVPARQAFALKNNGKIVYFCSETCRSKFITSQGENS